ncbi:MAG TPA: hypothetical protein VGK82_06490 [Pyrinomonadaceae bacterium]
MNLIRDLPVRPSLQKLRHEAETLHNEEQITLPDAQEKLARSYGAPNWSRLVQSCELIDAIWLDDPAALRKLIDRNPNLLHENARIVKDNWGPPLTYAANLGRNEIIRLLYDLGARDLQSAMVARCCKARSTPRGCCTR